MTVKNLLDASASDLFRAVLCRYGVNEPELWEHLLQVLELRDYAPDQHIVRAGEMPTHFFVILNGLVRYYYSSPEGKDWNKAFFHEGALVGSLSAYLKQQPCTYSIEVLEKSRLVAVPLQIFTQQQGRSLQMQGMLDKVTREIMLRNESREALLLTCNSEQRYRWLRENENWLLARVPQYQLASYLSMDAVSFSRIKRKLGC
ncbi:MULTISPECIES: Crp/Fnr family transcriptional regulator [unclassified Pseudomonas]|uniref:Crp/Fnr family transcriptional regulator n=1 Tax=Pseudomonas sp. MYb327 TaxID=2745230 RepID=A0AAU8E783_9PSED